MVLQNAQISVTAHAAQMHTSVKHPGTAATKDMTSAWVVQAKPLEPNELGPPGNIPRQESHPRPAEKFHTAW